MTSAAIALDKLYEQKLGKVIIIVPERSIGGSIAYEDVLVDQLLTGLEAIDGVEIYGPLSGVNRASRVPTVSFRHRGVGPEAIAKSLGGAGIFVWSGHNYAYEMARTLGIEEEGGLRIGIAHYNTKEEVQAVIKGVKTAVGEVA